MPDEYRRVLASSYDGLQGLDDALHGGRFRAFAVDPLPGVGEWCRLAGWMALTAMSAGKAVVIVLPTMREVNDLSRELTGLGLRMFERTVPRTADTTATWRAERLAGTGGTVFGRILRWRRARSAA